MLPVEIALPAEPQSHFFRRHQQAIATVACGAMAVAGWIVESSGMTDAATLLFVVSFAIGGYRSAYDGLRTLFVERELDVDLLMVVAAIGAGLIGYWLDGAILIFIFSLSGTLESYVTARSQRELRALMQVRPEQARLLRNDEAELVPAGSLQVGDRVLVKPGERIPADGKIRVGISAVNQAPITGESMPLDKGVGDEVFAGTLNGEGALQVEVTQPPEASLIARIVKLVEQATAERPAAQLFIERFEKGYARAVVAGAILVMVAPPLLLGWSWPVALYRSMVLLVVASPCALVVSMMPTLLSGIAAAARKGVLIKGGGYLEAIGTVQVLAFDKTGTLTSGVPKLTDVFALNGDADGLLTVVAAAESLSDHPIARAVVAGATARGLSWNSADDLQSIPGRGLRAVSAGKTWWIGSQGLMRERGLVLPPELVEVVRTLQSAGKSILLVADDAVRGVLAVQDTVRPEASQALAALRRSGISHLVMLTGDSWATAKAIGDQLGLDEVFAELLPEQKVAVINRLTRRFQRVGMVGDGVNDAPALAAATLGIAMGRGGTAVALEVADIVLMADDLAQIDYTVRLGRRANSLVRANLTIALGVIFILVAANFAAELTLPLGVIGHEGSTVLVTLNGLRMLTGPNPPQAAA